MGPQRPAAVPGHFVAGAAVRVQSYQCDDQEGPYMRWIPGSRSNPDPAAGTAPGKGPASGAAAAGGVRPLAQVGAQVAAKHPKLPVALFRLEPEVALQPLRLKLASALAEASVSTSFTLGGPGRVQAVLDGQLPAQAVLVVVTTSDDGAQDRLMDLVEWLLANGRQQLATHLIFAPVGQRRQLAGSFAFAHVPLGAQVLEHASGGTPLRRRAAAAGIDQLRDAVLDQALGLE